MQPDLAVEIWGKNKKVLGFGEIDHLLQLLQKMKPQLSVISYIDSENKPNTQYKLNGNDKQLSGVTLLLKVYDNIEKKRKCLKIFFLDHFEDTFFADEINHLFQSVKTLVRNDIILEVYNTYFLKINEQSRMYYIIEQEDLECSLLKIYQKSTKLPDQLKQIMETAINYCSDRSVIKLKSRTKHFNFPSDYLEYFYMVKNDNNQIKIKLNALTTDIFMNPSNDIFYTFNDDSVKSSKNKNNKKEEKIKELSSQLEGLLLDVKKLQIINKDNLVEMIQSNFEQLLQYHNIQIFQLISQHPKYTQFEIVEYDQDYFILETMLNGIHYNIKCEKFSKISEVEKQIKLYKKYYSIENNMFVPISCFEPLIFENSYYVLVEELAFPNLNKLNKVKKKNSVQIIKSLQQMTSIKCEKKKDQLRMLQIVVQILKFAQMLYKNNIFHGRIQFENVFVQIPTQYSIKPPDIYFSNPLFMREKISEDKDNDIYEDNEQLELAAYLLIRSRLTGIIDHKALSQLKEEIETYFIYLYEEYNFKKMQCNENQKINFYVSRLEEIFKIFDYIYMNNLPDKYIKITKNWMIALKRYRRTMLYDYSDEIDESQIFESDSDDNENQNQGYFFGLDQCQQQKVFEIQVEQVRYDFQSKIDLQKCHILNSMQHNSSMVSLHIKDFKSCPLNKDNWFNQEQSKTYLENLLRSCNKLIKLKLEVVLQDNRLIDLIPIQQMTDLQFIKLKCWKQLNIKNFESEKEIIRIIQNFKDLFMIFKINRQFNYIELYPFNNFINSAQYFNINWYLEEMNKTYYQIYNNLFSYESLQKVTCYSQFCTESINNSVLIEKVSRQQIEKEQLNDDLTQYLEENLDIKNYQHISAIQKLKEQLHQQLEKHVYLTCRAYNEKQSKSLIVEFENVLDDDMGKMMVTFNQVNLEELQVASYCCKSQERFDCQKEIEGIYFNPEALIKWIQCEYESKLKQNLFGDGYQSVCRHYDTIQFQIRAYSEQINLKKMTLYFDYCQSIYRQLMVENDFFKFGKYNYKSLLELNLGIYFDDKSTQNYFYKSLITQLNYAKSLVKINIDAYEFRKRRIRRQLLKLKRVVVVEFYNKR